MTTFRSKWRWTGPASRIAAGITAGLVLAQGALAGGLLGGSDAARDVHRFIGEQLGFVALAVFILAFLAWRPGRGPAIPAVITFLAMAAMGAQIGTGFGGIVEAHIPLGMSLFGAYLAVALWRPRPVEVRR